MATERKFRRGTAAEHANFTGAAGEVTVVTDDNSLRVHDGVTAGGNEIVSLNENSQSDAAPLKVKSAGSTELRELGDRFSDTISVRDFGAVGDGVEDDTTSIQAALDYGRDNGRRTVVFPTGTYMVSAPIVLETHVEGMMSIIKATTGFTGDEVINILATSLYVNSMHVRPTTLKHTGLTGVRFNGYNGKFHNLTASQFDYGFAVNTFSLTFITCSATACNTNVTAWAPETNKEINAINFFGGEYWGSVDYSFNIGDDRFTSPVNPSSAQGSNWKILGVTTDQGVMRIDRIMILELSAYFEAGTSSKQDSYIQIPNTGNVMGGVHIHDCNVNNAGGSIDYFVKCERPTKGLKLDNIQYTGIHKCLLYTPAGQDIYPVHIGALFPTASHTAAPSLHFGVRSGQPNLSLDPHTILGSVSNGMPTPNHYRRRTDVKDNLPNGVEKVYVGEGWLNQNKYGDTLACTVKSGSTSTVIADDVANLTDWESGMCVRVGSATGPITMILSINYENGEIALNYYSLTTETQLVCKEDKARSVSWSYQAPTTTDTYELGSIVWNNFANTPTPDGWVLKYAGWAAMS